MDFQRGILFVALALVLLLLWQNWLAYEQEKQDRIASTTSETGEVPAAPTAEETSAVPQAPEKAGGRPAAATPGAPAVQAPDGSRLRRGERITVVTDLVVAGIDTQGGDLRSLELIDHPVDAESPDVPFRLMGDEGADLFVAQSGIIGHGREYPNHDTRFEAEALEYRLADGADTLEVPLIWTAPDGLRYVKVYRFHRDSYLVEVEYRVENTSAEPWSGFLYGQFQRTQVVEDDDFGFFGRLTSYKGGAIYTPEEKYEKYDFSDMMDADLKRVSSSGWVAMLQHYFVGALLPDQGPRHEYYTQVHDRTTAPRYVLGLKSLAPTEIAPGASGTLAFRMFAGPKEQDRLAEPAEGLILTVDYGWLTPVASPLFWVLDAIHDVVQNWGWAIILLTLLIKLVFYPLSAASYKSMARMKKLQPRLQTLKERYGSDRQKLNQAMMEMYKKEKINPLGGCLPIIVQIPVFIALYWVLLESVELRQASFALWLNDLSSPDPYYVLPLLMGASMFAQQMLNPAPLDPIQKNVMMALPVVFTVFFLWFPAGLVLYWLVNNVLSIAQQWSIMKRLGTT